jgi:hypothetical protein
MILLFVVINLNEIFNLGDEFLILLTDKVLQNIYVGRMNISAGGGLRTSDLQETRHSTSSEPASAGWPLKVTKSSGYIQTSNFLFHCLSYK